MPNTTNTNNNPIHNQTQAVVGLKNGNQFLEMISGIVSKQIGLKNTPIHLYGQVISVDNTGNKADVQLSYGATDPIFRNLANKSGVILNINDTVMITAPTGDLTDCFIDKNNNPIPTIAGENIVGVLTIGGQTQNGQDNTNGELIIKGVSDSGTGNNIGIIMHDHTIDMYDWLQTGLRIGAISAFRNYVDGNLTGSPRLDIVSEQGCSTVMSTRNPDGESANTAFEVSNNAYNDGIAAYMHPPFYIRNKTNIDCDSTHALYIQSSADGENQLYGGLKCNQWNLYDVGSMNCVNLNVSGAKSAVINTKHYDKVNFYAVESPDNRFVDYMYGKTNNCECVIYIEPEVQECINTDIEYWVEFHPNQSCTWEITEKYSDYFVIQTDKDVEFMCTLVGMRKGFENIRLYHPDNILNDLITQNELDISQELTNADNDSFLIQYLLKNDEDELLNN